ncbi:MULTISPECIES: TetR/AcrR family transcriptional regulator [Paenibacillus]|uniref:TetR family transcriptional regulator n=1 Tax=Paenibacillus campinasensis TaxID=66347 RepID=A0A268EVX2_9BACL|nr:TetR/AcrR family transcriptional regulator [Paenibacillus campinasensis]MUG67560.1 TetR family transcriptional regulator [Paenibacillus campinasensis]PAD77272.1 TetR family transcriptional regulator [Paenibacillus campinasensis]
MATEKALRKRDLILDKAKELFIQHGYAATSMDDLVRYSGISKGSIYYHFESKEQLFVQILLRQNEEWMRAWEEKSSQYSGFEAKLYGVADHLVDDFYLNPLVKVAEEFHLGGAEDSNLMEQLLEIVQAPRQLYRDIFADGVREGKMAADDVDEMVIIFASMLDGMSTSFYERSSEDLRKLYHRGVDIFLRGIL